jgi:PLP dependent protein
MPPDTRWHFIGHLQSNKAKTLVKAVPGLAMIETVDSVKLANRLADACVEAGRVEPLGVMVQARSSIHWSPYDPVGVVNAVS